MRKGQMHLDYAIGFCIFVVIIFLVAFISFEPLVKDTQNAREIKNKEIAQRISELLIKTPGYPEDWENQSIAPERLGFASEPWVLSRDKLNRFQELNYTEVLSSLNVDRVFITLKSYSLNFTRGYLPNPRESVSVINRYSILENETATLTIGIW